MATREEIAWAAGLFEGEGSAFVSKERQPRLVVVSTDHDVIARFHRIIGCGGTRTYDPDRGGRTKRYWQWSAQSKADVITACTLLEPWMCERRAGAIAVVRAKAESMKHRTDLRTHCPQGHPYSGDNLIERPRADRPGNHRFCRECHNARRRKGVTGHGIEPQN